MAGKANNGGCYFSHDANASRDKRMVNLRRKHGWAACGIFWAIIECLRETRTFTMPLELVEDMLYDLRIDDENGREVFEAFFEVGLLKRDGEKMWSESLLQRMGKMLAVSKKRSEAGRKGAQARIQKERRSPIDDSQAVEKHNENVAHSEPPEVEPPKISAADGKIGDMSDSAKWCDALAVLQLSQEDMSIITKLKEKHCKPIDAQTARLDMGKYWGKLKNDSVQQKILIFKDIRRDKEGITPDGKEKWKEQLKADGIYI